MCTITYLPKGTNNDYIITHNRDETVNRPALPPSYYDEYETRLYYPKDILSGGTWIGLSKQKRLMCFMNGAFEKYKRNPPYRKSRGIVLKELLSLVDLQKGFAEYNLENIEPFFSVLFSLENKRMEIYELIWDGKQKHFRNRASDEPFIWSSAMSYSKEEHLLKQNRFEHLFKEVKNISPERIWDFHHSREREVKGGLIINRGILQTSSISQLVIDGKDKQSFRFHDLLKGEAQFENIKW